MLFQPEQARQIKQYQCAVTGVAESRTVPAGMGIIRFTNYTLRIQAVYGAPEEVCVQKHTVLAVIYRPFSGFFLPEDDVTETGQHGQGKKVRTGPEGQVGKREMSAAGRSKAGGTG